MHDIKPHDDMQSLHSWASASADRCRLMLRHLVEIKRSDSSWMKVGLCTLLDKIKIPVEEERCDTAGGQPPMKKRALAKTLSRASSDSLQICGMSCQCPECRVAEKIGASDDDSVSAEAKGSTDIVPARPGAVAKMLAKPPKAHRRGPCKAVLRHTPENRRGGYILMHGKFLFGMTCKENPDAQEMLQDMAKHLNDVGESDREQAKDILKYWGCE